LTGSKSPVGTHATAMVVELELELDPRQGDAIVSNIRIAERSR
jgi:hypothetical protein